VVKDATWRSSNNVKNFLSVLFHNNWTFAILLSATVGLSVYLYVPKHFGPEIVKSLSTRTLKEELDSREHTKTALSVDEIKQLREQSHQFHIEWLREFGNFLANLTPLLTGLLTVWVGGKKYLSNKTLKRRSSDLSSEPSNNGPPSQS